MRLRLNILVWGFVFVCMAAGSGYAQQKDSAHDASLGDIARQLKAQKAKEPKPVMVITNDNLPTVKDEATGLGAGSKEKSPAGATAEAAPQGHDEKYYRSRMSSLQSQLDEHKRELEVLQQKLGQNQAQYYSNPQQSLMQQYSRSDINKLTADIDAKKQQVADDEKAIQDLRDQLRQEGGDPSWLP